jgi:hypothetical protein
MTDTPADAATALERALDKAYGPSVARGPFRGRQLSDHVVDALVAADIDAPERLLFMSLADIRAIPGIGKTGLGEIAKYRGRFIRGSGEGA